jgi:hypothetical protein
MIRDDKTGRISSYQVDEVELSDDEYKDRLPGWLIHSLTFIFWILFETVGGFASWVFVLCLVLSIVTLAQQWQEWEDSQKKPKGK